MAMNWSLQKKLITAFLSVAVTVGVVGAIGFYSLKYVTGKYEKIAKANLPNVSNVADMTASTWEIRYLINRAALPGTTAEQSKELRTQMESALSKYQQNDKEYLTIPFFEGEEALYNAQNEYAKKVPAIVRKAMDLAISDKSANHDEFVKFTTEEFRPVANGHLKGLQALMDFHNKEAEKSSKQAESAAAIGTSSILAAVIVGFGLAFAAGFFISRSLANALQSVATRLSNGAGEITSASSLVSSAGTELSSSATEQAAALQETVASVEEISAMVGKNADNARRSQEFAVKSHEAASGGKDAVTRMIGSIGEISRSNDELFAQFETSNQQIGEIVQLINEISSKTKVINDIVFQTKLLSFNASVEAARAGEQGKGFAVVAEEVGNLAVMSGNAAKEISEMLDSSVKRVETIVSETRSKVSHLTVTGKEKIQAGTATAQHCSDTLNEIVTNVSEMKQMVDDIAGASVEQSKGIQEISRALAQIDQVTQQNATASQQSATASEQLTTQAQELRGMVQELEVLVQGGQAASGRASSTQYGSGPSAELKKQSKAGSYSASSKVVSMSKKRTEKKEKAARSEPTAEAQYVKAEKTLSSPSIPSEDDDRFKEA